MRTDGRCKKSLRGDEAPGRRRVRAVVGVLAAIVMAATGSACTTTGQPTAATAVRGPTIAFESIDGPPESVFHRFVQQLSDEADARQVAVVSRAEVAQYRVRSYVSAQTLGKRSSVAWVWDVYDADQHRALRISGEEPASFAGTGTWAVADDQVMQRVARAGMDRLVAFLAAPAVESRPAAPAPIAVPTPRIASASEDSGTTDIAAAQAPADAAIPLPARRPDAADSLAYLDTSR